MRWAKDLPYYDVYAPRDATRCLRAVEGAMHCGRRGGRRGCRRSGRGRTTKATSRVIRIHAADMRASSVVMRPTPGAEERVRLDRATGFHVLCTPPTPLGSEIPLHAHIRPGVYMWAMCSVGRSVVMTD